MSAATIQLNNTEAAAEEATIVAPEANKKVTRCIHILQSGKNKDQKCGKPCLRSGGNFCYNHAKKASSKDGNPVIDQTQVTHLQTLVTHLQTQVTGLEATNQALESSLVNNSAENQAKLETLEVEHISLKARVEALEKNAAKATKKKKAAKADDQAAQPPVETQQPPAVAVETQQPNGDGDDSDSN